MLLDVIENIWRNLLDLIYPIGHGYVSNFIIETADIKDNFSVKTDINETANKAFLKAINYIKEFLINIGVYSISKEDFDSFEKLYFGHNEVNEYLTTSQLNISYNMDSEVKKIEFSHLPYYINNPKKETLTKGDITISIPCLSRKKKN